MEISFLGGAREVGRSAYLLEGSKKVLLDCGIKLGETEEYPLIDRRTAKGLDEVILSHAHLDHSGFLAALYSMGYGGKVFLTKPTRDLIQVLLADYLRINKEESAYAMKDVEKLLKHSEIEEYETPFKQNLFYNAGHILGAAMPLVKMNGHKILYTGDLNTRSSRLLEGATTGIECDTLVIESTYGGRKDRHISSKEAGQALVDSIKHTFAEGGKVLIPTFAIGRGQEILFTLESYLRSGGLEHAPVYLDGMINKVLRIYRHNAIYLKKEIQHRILTSDEDPFKSKHFLVPTTKDRHDVLGEEKAIILATSGMLNGGPVLLYLEALAPEKHNKIIIVGFQAEGSRGRKLLEGKKEIELEEGKIVEVKMRVEEARFTAHSDSQELVQFAKALKGLKQVFVVHGEEEKPFELAEQIEDAWKGRVEAIVPKNGESIRL